MSKETQGPTLGVGLIESQLKENKEIKKGMEQESVLQRVN